jgi:hypothetical protein
MSLKTLVSDLSIDEHESSNANGDKTDNIGPKSMTKNASLFALHPETSGCKVYSFRNENVLTTEIGFHRTSVRQLTKDGPMVISAITIFQVHKHRSFESTIG